MLHNEWTNTQIWYSLQRILRLSYVAGKLSNPVEVLALGVATQVLEARVNAAAYETWSSKISEIEKAVAERGIPLYSLLLLKYEDDYQKVILEWRDSPSEMIH